MMKKLALRLMMAYSLAISITSCRSEDLLNSNEESPPSKFIVFSAQSAQKNGTVNYGNGFKTLLERYDEINNVQHTAKALKNAFEDSSTMADEYIEFNIRSQDFTTKNNEKYILFPLIKSYQVEGIVIAILKDDETIVEFNKMSAQVENYSEILGLFRTQYIKSNMKIKSVAKSPGGPCGFEGQPPCDIEVIIITVPGPGTGGGTPPGGGGGPSGGCGPYEDCVHNPDAGGSGGGGTPPANPCSRLRAMTDTPTFKGNITNLEGKTGDGFESGFRIGNSAGGIQNQILQNKPGTNEVNLTVFPNTVVIMHSHYDQLYPIFSPGDILFFNQWVNWAQNYNSNPANFPKIPLDQIVFTIVSSWGNYSFTFDGSVPNPFPNFTTQELIDFNNRYIDLLDAAKSVGNVSGNVSFDSQKLEKGFLKFMNEKMNIPGAKLFRNTSSGNTQLSLVNGKLTETNCP
ncbi:hypothetical protein [Chryseobacterium sp. OV279]|uniref:hypothetical protein n=1 Tax=Chryseobacterium sp. OV279 TaxID=1500285 RepID=UPI00090EBE0A|nr:hypothetical protein [Chryseobacterium sp. OV279]SHE64155.1 hypothetical protein SAMN02787100_0512 [Chryseobacterium sp. OV279]